MGCEIKEEISMSSFSFALNTVELLHVGARQHQHKRLCFQHENVTGVNQSLLKMNYVNKTQHFCQILMKIAKLICNFLQNYPPIDVRLIIEKARQLST